MPLTLKQITLKSFAEEDVVPAPILDNLTIDEVMTARVCNQSVFEKFADNLNWDYIVKTMPMSETTIERFSNYLAWNSISRYQRLSESFIERHSDQVNWENISAFQQLSFDFVQRHPDEIDIGAFFNRPQLLWTDAQFEPYLRTLPTIWTQPGLSEEFIRRNSATVFWFSLSCAHRAWSDEFFLDFFDDFELVYLARHAILNESQIERLLAERDDEIGEIVSEAQVLSSEFIWAHQAQLDWVRIAARQKLDDNTIRLIQDWSANASQTFSLLVTDLKKIGLFPRLCDWDILSARHDMAEEVLIANVERVVWHNVWIDTPSDTFLAACRHHLRTEFIASCASEQFLTSHPMYVTRDTCSNARIISMVFLDKYFELFGADNLVMTRYLSKNFVKKHKNRLNARLLSLFQP